MFERRAPQGDLCLQKFGGNAPMPLRRICVAAPRSRTVVPSADIVPNDRHLSSRLAPSRHLRACGPPDAQLPVFWRYDEIIHGAANLQAAGRRTAQRRPARPALPRRSAQDLLPGLFPARRHGTTQLGRPALPLGHDPLRHPVDFARPLSIGPQRRPLPSFCSPARHWFAEQPSLPRRSLHISQPNRVLRAHFPVPGNAWGSFLLIQVGIEFAGAFRAT